MKSEGTYIIEEDDRRAWPIMRVKSREDNTHNACTLIIVFACKESKVRCCSSLEKLQP